MNLFRSEEHLGNWPKFDPASAESIIPVADKAFVQGTESRRHWLDQDYLPRWFPRRARERDEAIERLRGKGLTRVEGQRDLAIRPSFDFQRERNALC